MTEDININHLARLAKISLTDKEAAELRPELEKILDLMANLNKIDTSQTAPLVSVLEAILPPAQSILPLRDDIAQDQNHKTALMQNAPAHQDIGDGSFFTVPTVVDDE